MCQFNLDVRKVLDPVHLVHKPWGTLPLFLWHLSVRWPFAYICIYLYILPFSFLSDLIIRVHTSYLSIFVHHCIFRHVKVDQKVRKFATYIHTQCFQLGFTRTADHLMTTTVYRWVVTHNLWVNLLFCFENILSHFFTDRLHPGALFPCLQHPKSTSVCRIAEVTNILTHIKCMWSMHWLSLSVTP